MPKKSKKASEPETPAVMVPETEDSAKLQITAVPAGESDLPSKKPARKTRAKKSAVAETAAVEVVLPEPAAKAPEVEAEAHANAADTFDDAFEANGASEAAGEMRSQTKAPPAASPKPKKARKTKKAEVAAPEPEPQADGDSDDLDSTEDDELEGDWESGSGPGLQEEEDEDTDERQAAPLPAPKLERLQKILAAAGIASRRHAEELMTEGRVQVNGKVVTELGSKADSARDHIRVDGKLLHGAERLRYFVLNKPRGFVTTVSDPEGRATVMDFFAKMNERLYPIGRLDYLSEGLLLMTNDGELANKLTRAASGVEKTYLVKVSGQPSEELIDKLREGVSIERGRPGEGRVNTSPARIQEVRSGDNPWFEVTLIEGRNRELRKMFEEIGHFVEKIRRVGYGPLVLDLEPGEMRELDEQELKLLRLAAEGKWKPKRIKAAAMLPKEAGRSVNHEGDRKRSQGWRPPNQDRRPGGRAPAPPGRGSGSFADRGRSQDRGAAARGGEDSRQTGFGPQTGGQDRGQGRAQFGSRPAPPRREGAPGFVRQDRTGERPAPRAGQRDGQRGWQGGADRGGQRSGFSRPQGDRPFRPRPAFDAGRRGSEARPPRPAWPQRPEQDGRGFKPRTDRPARSGDTGDNRGFKPRTNRPPAGAGDQRFGSRPPRPGQFGNQLDSRGKKPRWDRPAVGAGEQRSDSRPPRPAGSGDSGDNRGFKPRTYRPANGRPPEGGSARTFGERPAQGPGPQPFTQRPPRLHIEEESGGSSPRTERPAQSRPAQPFTPRPPRPAAGGFRPERGSNERRGPSGGSSRGPSSGPGRGPAGAQGRGPSGGRPSPGGRPSFGSGQRGRPSSGPPRGKRPGTGGPRGSRDNNKRGR
jgi:23S rRNA pseudouridine2605 synthase